MGKTKRGKRGDDTDKENNAPNKRRKTSKTAQNDEESVDAGEEDEIARLRKENAALKSQLTEKTNAPPTLLKPLSKPTDQVIELATRQIAINAEVRARLLVPFRDQPFAKKINLESLAKEILANPDLAPNLKYPASNFVKSLASKISAFYSNQRTQIARMTWAAVQNYHGWTAIERSDAINGAELDLCHLKTIAYLGYLEQKEPASQNMLDYISSEILPECYDKLRALEPPMEEEVREDVTEDQIDE